MDLAEPQAVRLQTRFLPEGVAQGTHEPRGNGQVAGLPQWTEVPSQVNILHQIKLFQFDKARLCTNTLLSLEPIWQQIKIIKKEL